jgi:hypothetical protein
MTKIDLSTLDPVPEAVEIRGLKIPVSGLSLTSIRDLMVGYPAIGTLIAGGLDAAALITQAPDIVTAILAAGTGADEAGAAVLARLPAGEQLALLNAIIRLTSPGGIGPFVEVITNLAATATAAAAPKATSPTSSRRRPPPSSAADTALPT